MNSQLDTPAASRGRERTWRLLRQITAVPLIALCSVFAGAALAQVSITPNVVPGGTAGTPYSQAFLASGGVAPYAFTNEVGRLPNVLTLTPAGLLSGTPQPATVPFEIWATDADGREARITAGVSVIQYTLALSPALPPGMIGQPYAGSIGVSGGVPPYTCTITSGSLPLGVTLGTNCTISGVPAIDGTYTFTIQVSDASGGTATSTFSLIVAAFPAVIPTLSTSLLVLLGMLLVFATAINFFRKAPQHRE